MRATIRITRTIAIASAGAVLSLGLSATTANAEPNPCAGRSSDSGSGGSIGTIDPVTVYGTWYNCGGGTGADRKKLNIANADDGPCITIPYGSTGSSTVSRYRYISGVGPAPRYNGWISC
ncbi:hypothetical protein [Streptosporangium sp. CA-115845]|uniref:hypothetical protein n=1 Tax=Streptosporangium sp. CA-115845 TaxID=3240071 RepID=UPI003D92E34D